MTIKFKGKKYGTEEWVYGSLIERSGDVGSSTFHILEKCSDGIHSDIEHRVTYYTVCQFTGHYTNKHEEIYAGDIISGCYQEGYGIEKLEFEVRGVVSWDLNQGKWIITELVNVEGKELPQGDTYDLYDYNCLDHISGNIHNNTLMEH